MAGWRVTDIPDQSGRRIVVTGGNGGLGAATVRGLAAAGASVIIASRDTTKGEALAREIDGDVTVRSLDLADLASVREFAAATDDVDVLINNAGIMVVPEGRTVDGFERHIGTNFLGHFALTGLLLPKLRDRVVTLSSNAHRMGGLDVDDLNWERRRYRRWGAYGASKLADLSFAHELDRRLRAAGSATRSAAAHPGYASTGLTGHSESIMGWLMRIGDLTVAQSASAGALPQLYAASMPDVEGGAYVGPDGVGEWRGSPRRVGSSWASRDPDLGGRLWDRAAELTGVEVRVG